MPDWSKNIVHVLPACAKKVCNYSFRVQVCICRESAHCLWFDGKTGTSFVSSYPTPSFRPFERHWYTKTQQARHATLTHSRILSMYACSDTVLCEDTLRLLPRSDFPGCHCSQRRKDVALRYSAWISAVHLAPHNPPRDRQRMHQRFLAAQTFATCYAAVRIVKVARRHNMISPAADQQRRTDP